MKNILQFFRTPHFPFLLGISTLFFFLRFPSLFEPYWYGDEGIYEVIGKALRSGRLLYAGIWDNKPPLLYLTYALFNADQFTVRLFSLLVGILTIYIFFIFTQKLFIKHRPMYVATAFFAFFFAIPLIEGNIANAENFMLLPIVLAGYLIYSYVLQPNHKIHSSSPLYQMPFLAGLLLSTAFLFRINALFEFAAFGVFLFFSVLPDSLSLKGSLKYVKKETKLLTSYIGGFVLPIAFTVIYFIIQGSFNDFFHATFLNNVGYVAYGNTFFIPQGFLIVKLFLLLIFVFYLFMKRHLFGNTALFIFLWTAFSVFSAFFSGRPYTHYALMSLPSISLGIGFLFEKTRNDIKAPALLFTLIAFLLIVSQFKLYKIQKTVLYYPNFVQFVAGTKSSSSYQKFFDWNTYRDYELASYMKTHLQPSDHVFLWGNSAQQYILMNTLPAGRYTVAYHIESDKNRLAETKRILLSNPPKYIVVLANASAYPLSLSSYRLKMMVENATIYEQIYK